MGKNEKEIIMYSRNLENVTAMYPDIEKNILETFKNYDSLIIEGEAVGLNPKTGDILPFQETVQRKRKYDIAQKALDIPLRLIVFEVLYLDGKDFIEEKFEKRREILERIVGARSLYHARRDKHLPRGKAGGGLPLQRIVLSEVAWCTTPAEIEKKFAAATAATWKASWRKRLTAFIRRAPVDGTGLN